MSSFLSNLKSKVPFLSKKEVTSSKPKKPLFMWFSLKERITFIKQLSILIRAGIPILAALRMLQQQSKSKTFTTLINQVIEAVENGQYLATALAKFKRLFGELTINIISIGEISGNLSSNLDHLAITLKKQQTLHRKVMGAAVYPIFIVIATIGITIMLTVFFFPKLIPIFKSVNYNLPWTTKFLIFISGFMQHNWVWVILGLVTLVVGVILLLRIKKVRFWYDATLLTLPLLKNPIQIYNATNMCRTLGLLLKSGVGIIQAFHITSSTTSNVIYKAQLQNIADNLTKGEKISTYMHEKSKWFPIIMGQMVAVGESTGKLSETFIYLADIFEEEMDDLTKNLSTTIEPLLLIFMGVLVGFVAISIITPIYGITQHLSPQ
jgi:type IV pilus assembly protein PilC